MVGWMWNVDCVLFILFSIDDIVMLLLLESRC